jgi:integrase
VAAATAQGARGPPRPPQRGQHGGLPRDPSQRLFAPWTNIRRDLHQACERVRVAHDDPTFPNVSPNDLRRTFATWCIQAGMPTTRVAMLLGHRDARMVERVYGVLDGRTVGRDLAKVFDAWTCRPSRHRPG